MADQVVFILNFSNMLLVAF